MEKQLRVVIFQESGAWIAQCLEHDIGAQAADLKDLQARLMLAVELECESNIEAGRDPFASIPPAPTRYQAMWDERAADLVPHAPPSLPASCGQPTFELAMCA